MLSDLVKEGTTRSISRRMIKNTRTDRATSITETQRECPVAPLVNADNGITADSPSYTTSHLLPNEPEYDSYEGSSMQPSSTLPYGLDLEPRSGGSSGPDATTMAGTGGGRRHHRGEDQDMASRLLNLTAPLLGAHFGTRSS